MWTVLTAV